MRPGTSIKLDKILSEAHIQGLAPLLPCERDEFHRLALVRCQAGTMNENERKGLEPR